MTVSRVSIDQETIQRYGTRTKLSEIHRHARTRPERNHPTRGGQTRTRAHRCRRLAAAGAAASRHLPRAVCAPALPPASAAPSAARRREPVHLARCPLKERLALVDRNQVARRVRWQPIRRQIHRRDKRPHIRQVPVAQARRGRGRARRRTQAEAQRQRWSVREGRDVGKVT